MSLTFSSDVRGPVFLELLEVLTTRARGVGLVSSRYEEKNPRRETVALLTELEPRRVVREETRAWPGCHVPDWAEPVVLLAFEYDGAVARTLFSHCPELLGWQDRGLPYDLHLMDASGATVLGSITSEHDAWVEMSSTAWRELVDGTQLLGSVPMREDA